MQIEGMGRLVLSAAAAAVLVACGGGGGDESPTGQEPAQAVTITQENATSAGAEGLNVGGTGFVGGSMSVTGVQVAPTESAPASAMSALAGALRKGVSHAAAPAAVVGATVNETVQCAGGGTIAVSFTVANQNGLSAGDSASLTFNNCVDEGTTSNGALSIVFVTVNSAQTLVVGDVTATQFTATRGALGERVNGTVRLSVNDADITKTVVDVTSSGFTFERLLDGAVRANRSVSNFVYREETSEPSGATSETFSYTATGTFPRLGTVSFTAATTAPIVTPAGATHPTSGAGKVTGKNGASVTVTVVTGGVRLEVDTDGNGTIDHTLNRTWAEFDAEL